MNYYAALERKGLDGEGTGKFDYTQTNDHKTWPVGFCSGDCDHNSKAEAQEHFKEYLLSIARFDTRIANQKRPCAICGEYTDRVGSVPSHYVHHILCDEHCNTEGLSQVLSVGESAQS